MGEFSDDPSSEEALQKIALFFDNVIETSNFGEFVNLRGRERLDKVLTKLLSPKPVEHRLVLGLIPQETVNEFYLPLVDFDVSAKSKSGYYPQNTQLAAYFREFLKHGYLASAESIVTKFPSGDSTRRILLGSVGIIDGFCKIMIMTGICIIIDHLEFTDDQLLLPGVKKLLDSFSLVRCCYTHRSNPAHHYLDSLRIQYVTSQKQSPSAIDYLGSMKEAVAIEKRLASVGSSKALKDVLGRCVSEYNKMVTKKAHRVTTEIKNLILNLLRTDDDVQRIIHKHYDSYPHTQSALPVDVLQQDFWVPGSCSRSESSKYAGKPLFKEVLTVTVETCKMWMVRATEDFKRLVSPSDSVKAKKNAQLNDEQQLVLHDLCCLWVWLKPRLDGAFPAPVVEKHKELFMRGALDSDLAGVMKAAQPFEWERIPFILEVRGEAVDDFICQAQDRTRNAHSKSLAAAWNVWKELLQSDQMTFQSEKISSEKEAAKRRTKLVGQLEEMHTKAWDLVGSYLKTNLETFTGKSLEAESTILPSVVSWIQDTLSDVPEVKATDDHCVVLWCNMTTVGVMPAAKYDFFLTSITNILATHKRNGLALIVHCNRASDTGRKCEKKEKMEPKDESVTKEEDDDDDDGEKADSDFEAEKENPEEADIREIRHKLEIALSAKSRNLCVKNVTWVFDKATVYGKRDACLHGLAVVHRDKLNIFRSSDGWKHGLIRDCAMLPRSSMFKPDAVVTTPHLGRAFTDAQELRQVAGGTDIVRKSIAAFLPPTIVTSLVVDLHCYDCWRALAALEACAEGQRILCSNVVLDKQSTQLIQRLGNKVYDACRSNQIQIVGFPQFDNVIKAIQNIEPNDSGKQYEVTVKKHDRLVVLQSLASKWLETEFKEATIEEIESHNQRFNDGGEYWHGEEERQGDDTGRPRKRIKLEDSELAKESDVSSLVKPYIYQINNCAELVSAQEGRPVYLVSRGKNQFLHHREMFSFGSGDWRVEADAMETMEDPCGRWFSFSADLDTVMVLEKKHLASHLQGLPCVESPTCLKTIIRELEDAGEVKLALTNHDMSPDNVVANKPLVFQMDPVKQDREDTGKAPKKKQKKSVGSMTEKNFGSIVDVTKIKAAKRIVIAWRVRLESSGSTGVKTLVPIRPIACVNGVLDLKEATVKLF